MMYDFLSAAEAIARHISRRAIYQKDDGVQWLSSMGEVPASQPRRIGYDLYGGTAGIILFLAALDYVRATNEYRNLVLVTARSIGKRLAQFAQQDNRRDPPDIGIGGFVGLGGLLYLFVRLTEWLSEPELMGEVERVLQFFTPTRISSDKSFDIIGGSAGAILALLALDSIEVRQQKTTRQALSTAYHCARHIVEHVSYVGDAKPRTSSPYWSPLAGFSHGAAGISLALLRFYAVTRQEDVLPTAIQALQFERSLYSAAENNWRDLRYRDHFMNSWCHGAPGIGLARLAIRNVLDDRTIEYEIQAAMSKTAARDLTDLDNLCCGNIGRAEVLLYAWLRTADCLLFDRAHDIALSVAKNLHDSLRSKCSDPTLMRGLAGIGFAFLHITAPTSLPSILLLE